ncbi:MAG: 3,4-dihydroxy-2-butanone-4-phosphate synthase [Bacteroidota bacterium]
MDNGIMTKETEIKLHSIEEAIADIKAGKVIIVVDDEDRENEGDFICAAETVTPEIINFMATHGRGLICTPIDERRADELDLPMMVSQNTALHETAFTVSIDLIGQGCTTGISAYDRATGIRALTKSETKSTDYARPGHIFPLRAKAGGVLRRTGHTEAAIDLAKMAGFYPAGVLVEILNEDGTMARLPDLMAISERFGLKIIAIKDLVAYRMRTERLIKREISFPYPSSFGEFEIIAYTQVTTGDTHLAFKMGDWDSEDPVLVRAHSSAENDDFLGSIFGDYNEQIKKSLAVIGKEGKGLLVLMRHEEKGRTLLNQLEDLKRKADAKEEIKPDRRSEMEQRDYGVGAQILNDLGVRKIRLITNTPRRRIGLIGYDLEIVENVQL